MKPNEINTKEDFWKSLWRNSEKETIARNIVIIMKKGWKKFTWDEYKKKCGHSVTIAERDVLDDFVEEGYLDKTGDHYMTNNLFYAALEPYRKK